MNIKMYGDVLTSIYVNSSDLTNSYDRINTLCDEENGKLKILDESRLFDLSKDNKNEEDFKRILESLKQGKFTDIEMIKEKYDLERYSTREIGISDKVINNLKASDSNKGEIRVFSKSKMNNNLYIPGSTIKGLIESMYFMKHKIKQEETKPNGILSRLFSCVSCDDSPISGNPYIQELKIVSKKVDRGININCETMCEGSSFEININVDEKKIDILCENNSIQYKENFSEKVFENMVKEYSEEIIARENEIIENVYNKPIKTKNGIEQSKNAEFYQEKIKFIAELRKYHKEGKYPVKLGMYKKGLSYIMDRDGWVKENSKNKKGGKASLGINEANEPMGWILLSL